MPPSGSLARGLPTAGTVLQSSFSSSGKIRFQRRPPCPRACCSCCVGTGLPGEFPARRQFSESARTRATTCLTHAISVVEKNSDKICLIVWNSRGVRYETKDCSGIEHYKTFHCENEFARRKKSHISVVGNFWSFAKRRLAKFRVVTSPSSCYLWKRKCTTTVQEIIMEKVNLGGILVKYITVFMFLS